MSRAPRTLPTAQESIRQTCADLETRYDEEALSLLCGSGIFAVDDPGMFDAAIDRLRERPPAEDDLIVETQTRAFEGASAKIRQAAVSHLDRGSPDVPPRDRRRSAARADGSAATSAGR